MPTAKLDVCDIKFQATNPDGVICHLGSKVTQASLSREVATRASKRLAMRLTEGVFKGRRGAAPYYSSTADAVPLLSQEKANLSHSFVNSFIINLLSEARLQLPSPVGEGVTVR